MGIGPGVLLSAALFVIIRISWCVWDSFFIFTASMFYHEMMFQLVVAVREAKGGKDREW